ncbi:MAG: hypothetical protein MK212_05860 [Saprospiraceae bacterium]|nr:hypothetical protein [Saprospiraceae bacterium]
MDWITLDASIILQYPTWFIGICVLVGFIYAVALYYRNKSFGEKSRSLNLGLGALRFSTVTIICLLLLSPVMKSTITEKKAPIVVLGQDESQSILTSFTEEEKKAYTDKMNALKAKLSEKYDLRTYSFGENVRKDLELKFEDKATNMAAFLEEVFDLYSGQNLGTVILASDGIYNQGNSPLYSGARLNVPIFSIALGDTIPKKDLVVKRVYNNKIAYLGDQFSMQVDLAAFNCGGAVSKLVVTRKGRKVAEQVVNVDNNDFFTTVEFVLDADRSGVQCYSIRVSPVDGEVSTANNSKDVCMDVLDARQKILLLAESPHPDIAALRRMIDANKNYEVKIAYADDLKTGVGEYDFVVLHQLPSKRNTITPVLNELKTKKIAHMYIVGTQSNLGLLNKNQNLLRIAARSTLTDDVEGILSSKFNTFTLNPKLADEIYKFPPLTAPNGNFSARADATVIFTQRIQTISTKYPLLLFGEEDGTKKAVLAAEGIWKWRMFDYMQHKNHDLFDEVFGKLIQYLSNKEDKRKFRAFANSTIYNENETISIDAELYNNNYERINEPEARLEVIGEGGKSYPFTFNKTSNAYVANIGYLPKGDYKFTAKTELDGEALQANGAFSVRPLQLELFETTADHQLLNTLSTKFGGKVVYPSNMDGLIEMIDAQGVAKPLLFDTVKTRSLIHLKWIFFLLLGLLTLEWFLRRFNGSY